MTDLDDALRAMLQERAHDVATVPAHVIELLGSDMIRDNRRSHRAPHRTGWLIAATVAAVLVVGGATIAVHDTGEGGRRTAPVHSGRPGPTVSTTPAPAPPIVRSVQTSWFTIDPVPGFTTRLRVSEPGFRATGLLRAGETRAPVGSNGGARISALVLVFDKGRYRAGSTGILGGARADVGAARGFLADTPKYNSATSTGPEVPTLAWEYAPDSWAVAQYVTDLTPVADTYLRRIAAATHPSVTEPMTLPFRLAYVPDMPLTEVVDDRPGGYTYGLTFDDGSRIFTITLSPKRTFAGTGLDTTTHVTIGGLPGFGTPATGYGVLFHDGSLLLSLTSDDVVTAADRTAARRVIAGLTWANGDGRGPGIPLTRAIP